MLIADQNLSDSASTIIAGSQVSSLPIENVQNNPVAKIWRTSNSNSDHILINMGSQVSIRIVALLGTNLTSSATIRIRADNSDTTATTGAILDTGVVDANIDDNYNTLYYVLNSDTTAQYWRIDLADNILSVLEVGRLFMGPAFFPDTKAQFGWTLNYKDSSSISQSLGNQTFIDPRNKERMLAFTLSFLSESEAYDTIFELQRRIGQSENILVMMNENETDSLRRSQYSIYGLINQTGQVIHRTIGVFQTKFQIKERL